MYVDTASHDEHIRSVYRSSSVLVHFLNDLSAAYEYVHSVSVDTVGGIKDKSILYDYLITQEFHLLATDLFFE
jgi:hypothetical protein